MATVSRTASPSRRCLQYLPAAKLHSSARPKTPVRQAARTFREFIELAEANPDKYNYASTGTGSSNHLTMEMLKQTAGISLSHVPYKGGGPAVTDVIGGRVPVMVINHDAALPHVRSGKLRALAV